MLHITRICKAVIGFEDNVIAVWQGLYQEKTALLGLTASSKRAEYRMIPQPRNVEGALERVSDTLVEGTQDLGIGGKTARGGSRYMILREN